MNSPRLPPLGKISNGKLNINKPATRASRPQNTNDQSNVAEDGNCDRKEHVTSRSTMLPLPNGEQQNSGSSFPRFAVLPPIPGKQPRSARLVLSNSNEVCDKRRGSGFVASSLRRGSSINHDTVFRPADGHNNDLVIVGNALGGKIQSQNDKGGDIFHTAVGGLSPTPDEVTGLNGRAKSSKNRGKPVASSEGGTIINWVGDELKFPRKRRGSSKVLNILRHNSDIANNASVLSANDAMYVSTNPNKLGSLNISPTTPRPLSRGQISFTGFEDGELGKTNQQSSIQEKRKSFGRLSVSMPVIQVDDLSSASEINNNEDNNEDMPSNWQLLVDSLENAKDELPKQQSIGVPYTSLREKRRRSALCRNNSKQVDDFLLVHNLRDLGLL